MDNEKRFSRNRPSRGVGLRKTTGCLACRRRHIKCDETRPQCGGCTRKKISCDFNTAQANPPRRQRRKASDADRSQTNANSSDQSSVAGRANGNNEANEGLRRRDQAGANKELNGHSSSPETEDGDIHMADEEMNDVTADITVDMSSNTVQNGEDQNGVANVSDHRGQGLVEKPGSQANDEFHTQGINNEASTSQNADVSSSGVESLVSDKHDSQPEPVSFVPEPPVAHQPPYHEPVSIDDTHPYEAIQTRQTNDSENYTHIYNVVYEALSPSQVPPYPPPLLNGNTPDSHANENSHYSPTSGWLKLLISDAALDTALIEPNGIKENTLDVFGSALNPTPESQAEGSSMPPPPGSIQESQSTHQESSLKSPKWLHPYIQERLSQNSTQEKEAEKQCWKARKAIVLEPHEHILFRHFIEHISEWMDLFDPQKPFGTFLPHLAFRNVGLMNAILALSSRHLGIVNKDAPTCAGGFRPDPNHTIQYYYRTLHYSQEAMQYDTFKTSLELLASALIISSYEMLDGKSTDWEKHLKGVFWIQRSQVIHGDSSGLRQAVWWAWICQDTWAAFREKRKPFTFWEPARKVIELSPNELAARAIRYFAQVVSYCANTQGTDASGSAIASHSSEARHLIEQIDEWKAQLTAEFEPIPLSTSGLTTSQAFPPIWIRPPSVAVAMQVYYCSLILLHLHKPLLGGFNEYIRRERKFKTWANAVCGIAMTSTDYGSSIMTTQCLYIAGMVIKDEKQRSSMLELLETSSRRAGWPGYSLADELRSVWHDESC